MKGLFGGFDVESVALKRGLLGFRGAGQGALNTLGWFMMFARSLRPQNARS